MEDILQTAPNDYRRKDYRIKKEMFYNLRIRYDND